MCMCTYSGESIEVLVSLTVAVNYQCQEFREHLLVVKGACPTLLGRGCMENPEQPERAEISLVLILMSTLYCVQILDDCITQPKPQKLGCKIPNPKYESYMALVS